MFELSVPRGCHLLLVALAVGCSGSDVKPTSTPRDEKVDGGMPDSVSGNADKTPCEAEEFMVSESNEVSDCRRLTVCSDEEYESTAPAADQDRVCATLSPGCVVGEVEVAAPTALSDRQCLPCKAGEYCAGGSVPLVWCQWRDTDRDPTTPCATVTQLLSACALDDAGHAHCWDDVGNGAMSLDGVRELTENNGVVCARLTDNSVQCWAKNTEDAEKQASNESAARQIQQAFDTLGPVEEFAFSRAQACAVATDQQLRCVELPEYSSPRYGSALLTSPPTSHGEIEQLVAGAEVVCSLDTFGSLDCWGNRFNLGVAIPKDLGAVRQVAIGEDTVCVLEQAGAVRCWRDYDQSYLRPRPPLETRPLEAVISISVGAEQLCAIYENGDSFRCWSTERDSLGQNILPKSVLHATALDNNSYCVVTALGGVYCWGRSGFMFNPDFAPPTGEPDSYPSKARTTPPLRLEGAKPQQCPSGQFLNEGTCSPVLTCAPGQFSRQDPTATSDRQCLDCLPGDFCAGGNEPLVHCDWRDRDADPTTPCTAIAKVEASNGAVCVLDTGGDLVCYGDGPLGDATQVPPLGKTVDFSLSRSVACAISDRNALSCWRPTENGGVAESLPVPPEAQLALSVSAGTTTCAVVPRGAIVCWNTLGELLPQDSSTDYVTVTGSDRHFCATTSTGACRCWSFEQPPGSGTPLERRPSTTPSSLIDPLELDSIGSHSCAITTEGKLMCWLESGELIDNINELEALEPLVALSLGRSGGICVVGETGELACQNFEGKGYYRLPRDRAAAIAYEWDSGVLCIVGKEGELDCMSGQNLLPAPSSRELPCVNAATGTPLSAGATCQGGVCNQVGDCVECQQSLDCALSPRGNVCSLATEACIECEANTDCPARDCQQAACTANAVCEYSAANTGTACSAGVCDAEGLCVGCQSDENCAGATPFCRTEDSTCVACLAGNDCPAPTQDCRIATCSANQCGQTGAPAGRECSTGVCGFDFTCGECVFDEDCSTSNVGPFCSDGECVECVVARQCESVEDECLEAQCLDHVCEVLPAPVGIACTGGECNSAGECQVP